MSVNVIELLLAFAVLFGVFSFGALLAEKAEDDDLAWLDEQIRRAEDGDPRADDNPEMLAQRRAYLERLRRVRERLVGGNRG